MVKCNTSLPAELWAVLSLLADGVGGLQRVHHLGVLLAVGDGADDLMHLVPELGGGQVLTAHLGGLADSSRYDGLEYSTTPPYVPWVYISIF